MGESNPLEDCSQLPEDQGTTHELALARCNCLMARYLRWKLENLRKSDQALRVTLIFTAITPVVLLIPWDFVNLLGAATSAVAAIATGLLAIHGWRDNYIRHGNIWHALQTEKYLYLTHAVEPYSNVDTIHEKENAARAFASRMEQLVMAEVTDWRAGMQHHAQKPELEDPRAHDQVSV